MTEKLREVHLHQRRKRRKRGVAAEAKKGEDLEAKIGHQRGTEVQGGTAIEKDALEVVVGTEDAEIKKEKDVEEAKVGNERGVNHPKKGRASVQSEKGSLNSHLKKEISEQSFVCSCQ